MKIPLKFVSTPPANKINEVADVLWALVIVTLSVCVCVGGRVDVSHSSFREHRRQNVWGLGPDC